MSEFAKGWITGRMPSHPGEVCMVGGQATISIPGSLTIVLGQGDDRLAEAITTAVNSHDDLLAACEMALCHGVDPFDSGASTNKALKAAIAAAKGGSRE